MLRRKPRKPGDIKKVKLPSRASLIKKIEVRLLGELMAERGACCEICGGTRQLGLFHVIPKGAYPSLRFHKQNLLIAGWFCCHFPWHHDFYEARDRIEPKLRELLGVDYESRIKALPVEKLTLVKLMELESL